MSRRSQSSRIGGPKAHANVSPSRCCSTPDSVVRMFIECRGQISWRDTIRFAQRKTAAKLASQFMTLYIACSRSRIIMTRRFCDGLRQTFHRQRLREHDVKGDWRGRIASNAARRMACERQRRTLTTNPNSMYTCANKASKGRNLRPNVCRRSMTIAEKPMNVIPSMPIVCRRAPQPIPSLCCSSVPPFPAGSKLGAAVHVDSVAGDPARIV